MALYRMYLVPIRSQGGSEVYSLLLLMVLALCPMISSKGSLTAVLIFTYLAGFSSMSKPFKAILRSISGEIPAVSMRFFA